MLLLPHRPDRFLRIQRRLVDMPLRHALRSTRAMPVRLLILHPQQVRRSRTRQ